MLDDREPLTVDEFIRLRAAQLGDRPLVSYPHSGTTYTDYSLQQLDVFAYRVAKYLAAKIPPRQSSSETPIVVSVLGPSDLNYLVTLFALAKLAHGGLLLSTRISLEAYDFLFKTTGSKFLLIHPSFHDVAEELQTRVKGLRVEEIPSQSVYDYPLTLDDPKNTIIAPKLDPVQEANNIAWIIHSSGSTGLPKPLVQTQRAALRNYSTNNNMCAFMTTPLYHNYGISSLFRCIYICKSIHFYNAFLPLTSVHLLKIMQEHEFEIFYAVPYALKLLAETEGGVRGLARLKAVMYAGSVCPDALGNRLVDNGVHLISHYGSFEERGPGIYELVCLDGWPAKVVSNRPDGAYTTKDLFTKHPTLEAYKFYARLDDTIVLVNGEKVNPLMLEGLVREHPAVSEAVVVGAGQDKIGMIIIPSEAVSSFPDDHLTDQLWPTVTKAQKDMPAYGQLSRDMIKILPPDTTYPRTDKGTVIRQAFYRKYSDLIESLFKEETPTGSLSLSEPELKAFLIEQLKGILSPRACSLLTEDIDLFNLGMDSLQATQLRSAILRYIDLGGRQLSLNTAFDHPTVNDLAHYLFALRFGEATNTQSMEDPMQVMIDKYSVFIQHQPMKSSFAGRYVVVTGGTGSLGSHVIQQLASIAEVQKIYCLIRAASSGDARDRLDKSLHERRISDNLPALSRNKLVALPSDLSKSNLGLDAETYTMISSQITDLIHCAWSVNFNLQLSSFEKDSIAGVQNLINLCLKAQQPNPASFTFCSSISAVINIEEDKVRESLPAKLSAAQGTGYSQSKLVAEHICVKAADKTKIQVRVLRIGQVVGDTVHGIWNPSEAIPLMLQSAVTIGALPRLDEVSRWLPVDIVASIIIDTLSLSKSQEPSDDKASAKVVLNIVNPHSFHWTRDLLPLLRKSGLEFKELAQREWIQQLRSSNLDPVENPPIKLVEFFARKYDTDSPLRALQWDTEQARRLSRSLDSASPLGQELVDKMVGYFVKECWK